MAASRSAESLTRLSRDWSGRREGRICSGSRFRNKVIRQRAGILQLDKIGSGAWRRLTNEHSRPAESPAENRHTRRSRDPLVRPGPRLCLAGQSTLLCWPMTTFQSCHSRLDPRMPFPRSFCFGSSAPWGKRGRPALGPFRSSRVSGEGASNLWPTSAWSRNGLDRGLPWP